MQPNHLLHPTNLGNLSSDALEDLGRQNALELFHEVAERVPAYSKFLASHGIDHKKIKTHSDFGQVPSITKNDYLRKYPLHELMWDGSLHGADIINRSSGSSGQPFYWPSNTKQRNEVGEFYDLVFTTMFGMREKKTLVIICYGMGTWVAGTTTLLSTAEFMGKYDCTVVTPGYNKQEVVEICQNLAPAYEQIVICAYPPLVKEIVDYGKEQGIKWSKLRPKFIFGAESFSEEFRDYILSIAGSKQPLLDSMNTIGSADAMVLGHETPLSIALRRRLVRNAKLRDDILGPSRLPTVAQYYPWQKYMEIVNKELHITSNGAMPLVKYNIQDNSKLYTYSEMSAAMVKHGYTGVSEVLPFTMRNDYDWKLPFILLYGKSTNAISFYGAFIYPENVKAYLERKNMAPFFTGKFRMQVYVDNSFDQRWRMILEMAPGVDKSQVIPIRQLKQEIAIEIAKHNTEYKTIVAGTKSKALPVIQLVPYGRFELNLQNKHKYAN